MRDPELDARLEENLATLAALALVAVVFLFYGWTIEFPSQYADVANLLSNPGAGAFRDFFAVSKWPERLDLLPDLLHRHLARPLLGMSYLLGSASPQPPVAGQRIFNILLHLLTTLLVYFAVRGALRDSRNGEARRSDLLAGALVAGAFALHPLQIEAVVYVSGRDGSFAGAPALGAFLALAASLRAARAGASSAARLAPYLFGIALFLLALGCGQGALALPLWLVLYDWATDDAATFRERASFHLPLLLLGAGYAALYRITADATGDAAAQSVLANAPGQWLAYWRLLALPVGLTVDHDFAPRMILSLAGCAALLGAAVFLAVRGQRTLSAAILAVFSALLPWAGLLSYRNALAEHRAYFAALAFVVLIALVGTRIFAKLSAAAAVRYAAAALAVLALGAGGVARAKVWESHESLWLDAVAKAPGLARPHYQLGTVYLLADRKAEAMKEFGEALRIDSSYAPAALNRGGLFLESGDFVNAKANFEIAVKADPGHAPSHYNLAEALLQLGDHEAALAEIRQAVKLAPENGNFLEKEGDILRRMGRFEEALAAWGEAVQKPELADYARLHERAGLLAFEHGYEATASGHLRMLTVIEPEKPESWYNFGYFKERIGEPEEAIDNYQRAIMLDPSMASAHFNLARLYEEQNKCEEAEGHYRVAGTYEKRFLVEYDNFMRAKREGARCPAGSRPFYLEQKNQKE